LLFKKDPSGKAAKIIDRLEIAIGKLLIAKRTLERLRTERKDRILIMTAFAGIPISSRGMAIMYIDSALKDLKKTKKDLKYLNDWLRKHRISKYYSAIKNVLEGMMYKIDDVLENPDDDIDVLIKKFTDIKTGAQELYDLLNKRI